MRKNRTIFAVAIAIFCLFSLTVQAQTANYSSPSGEVRWGAVLAAIEQNNLQLQAIRHEGKAAVLDMKGENVLAAPDVEYSSLYAKGVKGEASSELIVTQQFDFPTQYAQRRQRIAIEEEKASARYETVRREVLTEARVLYLEVIRLNQINDLLQQQLINSDSLTVLTERRLKAGDINILEVNRVKMERMELQKLIVQNEAERSATLQQLAVLNGGKVITISDMQFPEWEMTLSEEDFVREAMSRMGNIREATLGVKAATHELKMSQQSWLPSLALGYRRNVDGNDHLNGFVINASFPLYSTATKVKAARERNESAQLTLANAQQEAESAIRARYYELQNMHKVLDHTDTALLQETLQLLNKALKMGQLSMPEYFIESSSIYQKLQNHIDLHCQYLKLYAYYRPI